MAPPAARSHITIKHYIMAALTATLAAAVVITIIVVVLSPARIVFSITDARYLLPSTNTNGSNEGIMQLNLTVAANNTSRRTRVEYRSIFIDVSNTTGLKWENWVRAIVQPSPPLHQATRNVTNIYAVAPLVGGLWRDAIVDETSPFRVMITAMARFKDVGIPSRLYEIKVTCSSVTFLPEHGNKLSGGDPVAPLPIECGSG